MISRTLRLSVPYVSRHLKHECTSYYPLSSKFELLKQTTYLSSRNYAKGKDIKKQGKKKIEINEQLLSDVVDIAKIKRDMELNIDKMHEMFVKHLSIRSSLGSIEQLIVVVDGKKYPLIELGQIIRNNPKTIIINMTAFPQAIQPALKALSDSGMNLNPQQDGTTLFVPVPKVTREHRETLAKNAKSHFIKCKDGIRSVQNECSRKIKKQEKDGLSSDLSHQVMEQIKTIADNYIANAEKILEAKQAELVGA